MLKKFWSLGLTLALFGAALIQCSPAPAFADTTVENNNGLWVQDVSTGRYFTAPICYTTDGSGNLVPCSKVPGGLGIAPARLNTATTSVGTASYVGIVTSMPTTGHWVDIYNGTSSELILATGTAGNPVNVMELPASTSTTENLYLPQGTRLSLIAATATASSGVVMFNAVQ